jgi:hypothetical protein
MGELLVPLDKIGVGGRDNLASNVLQPANIQLNTASKERMPAITQPRKASGGKGLSWLLVLFPSAVEDASEELDVVMPLSQGR